MLILFGTMLILMLIGMPIAFTIGVSSLVWLITSSPFPLVVIPQKVFAGIDSWSLLSIPLFLLVGSLMNNGGITNKLIKLVNSFVGHIKGGLGLANVGVSMLFAGISGTALADTASIGAVLIPAMEEDGYDGEFACSVTVSSSIVGPIIPPSMPMILTGSLLSISIGKLFIAGAIPGIILGLALMAMTYYLSIKRGYPSGEKAGFKEMIISLRDALLPLILPIIMVGGIVFGIFTPTESASIGAVIALILGVFVYKTLDFKKLVQTFMDSAVSTASVMVLVGLAALFAWILSVEHVPEMVANFILSITENQILILILINLLLLFIGTFMETVAAILVVFPIVFQIATLIGMDPIHFGVMAVLALMVGLITPPLGVCLFVASSISNISIIKIAKANMPYLITILLVLFLVAFIPQLSLWLPSLFY
ncbi:TRAP transporter large permease [Halocella sp. SP3-1]|uniref:TRAP transporter large permease n=1 Tax=Halocella sp. SP3-1 TaxID=2382161 RepID=UPI000F7569C3|nr:TRAP transporter large permease [Halocella sp. SP3-1]AZO93430.1 TRAP transporter large permease [Halocella sp. SP3-1]